MASGGTKRSPSREGSRAGSMLSAARTSSAMARSGGERTASRRRSVVAMSNPAAAARTPLSTACEAGGWQRVQRCSGAAVQRCSTTCARAEPRSVAQKGRAACTSSTPGRVRPSQPTSAPAGPALAPPRCAAMPAAGPGRICAVARARSSAAALPARGTASARSSGDNAASPPNANEPAR
eukprot:scaffold19081_cov69-Phaeocystis_antarctica.AAC.2